MSAMMQEADLDTVVLTPNPKSVPNQFVTFTCGNRAFGVDIMSVREIRSWSPTTAMPNQPFGADGVLDIRGKIVEVYDLAAMLGAAGSGDTTGRVILVVSLGECDVGIIADTVSDIIFTSPEDMRPSPSREAGRTEGCVSMLVKNEDRLIAILDLAILFPGYTHH